LFGVVLVSGKTGHMSSQIESMRGRIDGHLESQSTGSNPKTSSMRRYFMILLVYSPKSSLVRTAMPTPSAGKRVI
jgi:hypothetical protein